MDNNLFETRNMNKDLIDVSNKDTTYEVLFEISQILNTNLTRNELKILIKLCDIGVNPNSLSKVVNQLILKRNNTQQNN